MGAEVIHSTPRRFAIKHDMLPVHLTALMSATERRSGKLQRRLFMGTRVNVNQNLYLVVLVRDERLDTLLDHVIQLDLSSNHGCRLQSPCGPCLLNNRPSAEA